MLARPMKEARGPSEGAVGLETEFPTSPELLARDAGAPSKSREALGKHPFLSKGPIWGFPLCLGLPPPCPWEEAEGGFFLPRLLSPVPAGLRVEGQSLGSPWCKERPPLCFSLSLVWGVQRDSVNQTLEVTRGLLLCHCWGLRCFLP